MKSTPTRGHVAQITDVAPIWLLLLRDGDGSNATPSRYPVFPPLGALSLRGREPPGGADTGWPPGYVDTGGLNPQEHETRSTEGPGRASAVRSSPLRTRQRSARRHERLCFLISVAWSPPHFSGATWPRAPHVLPRVFANVDVGLGTTLTLTLTLTLEFNIVRSPILYIF